MLPADTSQSYIVSGIKLWNGALLTKSSLEIVRELEGSFCIAHLIKYSSTNSGLMSGADQLTVRVEGPDASSITLIGGPDGSVYTYKDDHGGFEMLHTQSTFYPGTCIYVHHVQEVYMLDTHLLWEIYL